jgi:hypothetical protein
VIAEYRFLQTRDGVTRFAKVTVVSTESPSWSNALSDSVRELTAVYGEAIQSGLDQAIAEQNRRKGPRYSVVVTSLVETAVDSSPDAVECAVLVATWKSFGNGDRDVSISFDGGRWNASFRSIHGAEPR